MQFEQAPESIDVREEYLAAVQRSLAVDRSPREVYESIAEMRCHLNAMAEADVELGLEPVDAMQNAIQRFGRPENVAPPLYRYDPRSLNLWGIAKIWMAGMALVTLIGAGRILDHLPQAHPFYALLSMSLGYAPDMLMFATAAHLLKIKPLLFAALLTSFDSLWSVLNLLVFMRLNMRGAPIPPHVAPEMFVQSVIVFCVTFLMRLIVSRASTRRQADRFA